MRTGPGTRSAWLDAPVKGHHRRTRTCKVGQVGGQAFVREACTLLQQVRECITRLPAYAVHSTWHHLRRHDAGLHGARCCMPAWPVQTYHCRGSLQEVYIPVEDATTQVLGSCQPKISVYMRMHMGLAACAFPDVCLTEHALGVGWVVVLCVEVLELLICEVRDAHGITARVVPACTQNGSSWKHAHKVISCSVKCGV